MNLLQRLPDSTTHPAGLERHILRKLPLWLAAATAVPLICYLIAHLFPAPAVAESAEKYLTEVGIAVIASIITAWTAAFTTAIGCVIVVVMKGPGYVADGYPLSDAEYPLQSPASAAHPPSQER